MNKLPYQQVSDQIDRLFFSPLYPNETTELRSLTIEAYIESAGWTWDEVIEQLYKSKDN